MHICDKEKNTPISRAKAAESLSSQSPNIHTIHSLNASLAGKAVLLRSTMSNNSTTTDAVNPYDYTPSAPAAGIAATAFMLFTALHTYQLFRTRTWFFIPFIIGGYCKSSLAIHPSTPSSESNADLS